MRITNQELNQIMYIVKTYDKNVLSNYINEIISRHEKRRKSHFIKKKTIEFYNKMSRAFFFYYFKSFAGRYASECVDEAYTEGLASLKRNCSLMRSLKNGQQAGGKLYNMYRRN